MSHNPNTINSQDELNTCNSGKRSSDVLVEAISKLETTTKENERLQKQLGIAIECLKEYADENYYLFPTYRNGHERAEKALKEIEELNEIHKQA